jgi:hypothetical protein
MPDHAHAEGPFRCCESEPAERVLRKLKANPPVRQGKSRLPPKHEAGSVAFGESEESFERRRVAWRAAIERETRYMGEGR